MVHPTTFYFSTPTDSGCLWDCPQLSANTDGAAMNILDCVPSLTCVNVSFRCLRDRGHEFPSFGRQAPARRTKVHSSSHLGHPSSASSFLIFASLTGVTLTSWCQVAALNRTPLTAQEWQPVFISYRRLRFPFCTSPEPALCPLPSQFPSLSPRSADIPRRV